MNLEPVFVAANVAEADFVARLFEKEGIPYQERLEAVMRETSNVCYQGTLFEVPAKNAGYCRELLGRIGMQGGIIGAR